MDTWERETEVITLEELREQHDPPLSQRTLARILGFSHGVIQHYEAGRREPWLKNARKIAKFFGVPLERIQFKSRPKNTDPKVSEVA